MQIQIELVVGNTKRTYQPIKNDIQRQIDAVERAINNKKNANDDTHLIDVKHILKAIQNQLPEYNA